MRWVEVQLTYPLEDDTPHSRIKIGGEMYLKLCRFLDVTSSRSDLEDQVRISIGRKIIEESEDGS